MTNKNKVEAVQAGDNIIWCHPVPVRKSCGTQSNGHWYCVTHKETFPNNFDKDTHIGDGKRHRLAWICHEHGPEQP